VYYISEYIVDLVVWYFSGRRYSGWYDQQRNNVKKQL